METMSVDQVFTRDITARLTERPIAGPWGSASFAEVVAAASSSSSSKAPTVPVEIAADEKRAALPWASNGRFTGDRKANVYIGKVRVGARTVPVQYIEGRPEVMSDTILAEDAAASGHCAIL